MTYTLEQANAAFDQAAATNGGNRTVQQLRDLAAQVDVSVPDGRPILTYSGDVTLLDGRVVYSGNVARSLATATGAEIEAGTQGSLAIMKTISQAGREPAERGRS